MRLFHQLFEVKDLAGWRLTYASVFTYFKPGLEFGKQVYVGSDIDEAKRLICVDEDLASRLEGSIIPQYMMTDVTGRVLKRETITVLYNQGMGICFPLERYHTLRAENTASNPVFGSRDLGLIGGGANYFYAL